MNQHGASALPCNTTHTPKYHPKYPPTHSLLNSSTLRTRCVFAPALVCVCVLCAVCVCVCMCAVLSVFRAATTCAKTQSWSKFLSWPICCCGRTPLLVVASSACGRTRSCSPLFACSVPALPPPSFLAPHCWRGGGGHNICVYYRWSRLVLRGASWSGSPTRVRFGSTSSTASCV